MLKAFLENTLLSVSRVCYSTGLSKLAKYFDRREKKKKKPKLVLTKPLWLEVADGSVDRVSLFWDQEFGWFHVSRTM